MLLGTWLSVEAGQGHTCGRRIDGRIYCAGTDFHGMLGDGGGDDGRGYFARVAGRGTDWVGLSSSFNHNCVLRSPGRLVCWGGNGFGQLGRGNHDNAYAPTAVDG